MVKRFFIAIGISAFIFSCNDGPAKSVDKKQKDVLQVDTKQGKNNDLVYLDTAQNIYNILCQDWVLKEDAEGLEGMDESSKFEIPYRSFYFSTKGTFVKNPRNTFDYGTWSFDDASKMITINNTIDRGKDMYKIARIAADELVLVNVGINSATNLTFISSGKRFKNANEEPYLLENNRWRIKPKAKESDEAIHQRLKDNLHFFILFYKSILAKNDKSVSFWGLPSCFKWYDGAIFLKKEDELKGNWIDCFYNKDQAMQAYTLADKLLDQKYDWPKGEQNWLKLNLAVVELMYKKIDEIH
ncbi:MAG: hypothetical protein ABI685_12100 [Ferruginibacter sp.]